MDRRDVRRQGRAENMGDGAERPAGVAHGTTRPGAVVRSQMIQAGRRVPTTDDACDRALQAGKDSLAFRPRDTADFAKECCHAIRIDRRQTEQSDQRSGAGAGHH
jgi:hypothetical protein